MKLVSRSAWGARAYRSPAGATPYSGNRRGVKFHYLGTPYSDRPHGQCAAYVRALQASHMDGNGWSDIGYSFVVCTHGYVYEGRGLDRRNSANGNSALNNQDYAVLLLVGSKGLTKPTDAQLHGARDALEYVRREGPAGSWVGGHRDGYATACPGDAVYGWVQAGCPRPGGSSAPSGGSYTVRAGDTLGEIAAAHGTEADVLARLNGLTNPNLIYPGQRLTVPGEEDDMPSAREIAEAVWETDGLIEVPWGTDTNPEWMAKSILVSTGEVLREVRGRVKSLQSEVSAQSAAITELAKALAAHHQEVDADALVARITAAIENVTVRLDVADDDAA
ncbi:LysM peptidoglycan-binding domain-containing protein [Streptomyces chumphonensis]|uniref:LysM peptidoglycan-binding domain-containing protein n=1 Tax=Streptomyces chumphonensis TaxID=1214925 RepID=UPI003D7603ED